MRSWGRTKVGNLFAQFRRHKRLTQRELAHDLEISGQFEWLIEKGRALPSPEVLGRLCSQMGFNPNVALIYLFDDKVDIYREKVKKELGIEGDAM